MNERTASSFEGDERDDDDSSHPTIEGYTLVTTPPLPPFLRGGFGRVYRALTADGVLVAIKVSLPTRRDAVILERWHHECRLSLKLPPHEHVVRFMARTTARWRDGHETPALVMEWLEGARGLVPYADALGLDKRQRLDLFEQALDGVAWLHTHHTPHCDLKSSNMLVIERRSRAIVKITDFGGTRRAGRGDPSPPVYSLHRVAPEVVSGDPAAIDARADVYSLGKELAELIGGSDATRARWQQGHRDWRPEPIETSVGLADPELDAIIARATSIERTHRFADAQEMLDALRAYRPPRRERWTRRVERWFWPPPEERRGRGIGRLAGVLGILAIACAALAAPIANRLIKAGLAPDLAITVPRPPSMERVAIVRAKDPMELVRVAQKQNFADVTLDSPATARRVWARALERVVESKPAAIVFDVVFAHNPDESLNQVIADAIAGVRSQGIPVVVAVWDFETGPPDRHRNFPMAGAVLQSGATWGCLNYDTARGLRPVLWIPRGSDALVRPPLAVAALAAMCGDRPPAHPIQPVLDRHDMSLIIPGARVVRLFDVLPASEIHFLQGAPEGIDLAKDTLGIYPFALPAEDKALQQVEFSVSDLWRDDDETRTRLKSLIRDRVVVLAAYKEEDEKREAEWGRFVPGVWIHAAAIESLLTGLEVPQTPRQTKTGILAAVATVVGFMLGLPLTVMLLRAAGLAMPSLAGAWSPSRLQPFVAARRWRRYVAVVIVVAGAISVAWLILPLSVPWTIPYTAGTVATGAFIGLCVAIVLALFAAWMGLVRRAWCLDRSPEPAV